MMYYYIVVYNDGMKPTKVRIKSGADWFGIAGDASAQLGIIIEKLISISIDIDPPIEG